ncbi:MAG: hypothetical protein WAV72_05155 [Bradyrhizobium sp.]
MGHPKIERFIAGFGEFAPRTPVQHPSRIERRFLEYQVLKNRLGAQLDLSTVQAADVAPGRDAKEDDASAVPANERAVERGPKL